MAQIQFSNDASSLLAASIDDDDTVVQVSASDGALFPSPGAGQYFKLALQNASGDLEIMHCTSRVGDLLTVVRAQEGTAAQAWTNGVTRCELRNTAGTLQSMLQKTGDTMTGNLNMGGNNVADARLTGATVVVGGQLVGTAIRGTEDDASNEVVVPSDGSKATAGGSPILTEDDGIMEQMPIGAVIMWHGSLGGLPTGWQLCDGTNGTPDLRGVFPRGAGGAIALGAAGGSATATGATDAAGAHTPTGLAANHTLTIAEIPAHHHALRGSSGGGISGSGSIPGGFGLLSDFSGGHAVGNYEDTLNVNGLPIAQDTGGGGAHSHVIAMDAVGNHTHGVSGVSVVPPFVGIYFIKKVA